jgi:hypothetical protein
MRMTRIERTPVEMVLGNRQLAAILFLLASLLILVASISYVAGRLVAPVQAQMTSSPVANQSSVIVIDPLPVRGETPPNTQPIPARVIRPTPGEVFLQVAAVDRGMAEVTAEFLARKGFDVRIASGTTENEFRVLISGRDDLSKTRAKLEDFGFRSFVRKF